MKDKLLHYRHKAQPLPVPVSGQVLLIGGTSDIGRELASLLVPRRHVTVASRNIDATADVEKQLLAAGARSVTVVKIEATDLNSGAHRKMIEQAVFDHGPIETAIVAVGILGDAEKATHNEHEAIAIATVDYTAQVSFLTILADIMGRENLPSTIVAFSSIAGWRARRTNYVYGSAKAGVDAFCQGLQDKLHGSMVRLILARPGFVIGSMTEGMKPAPLSVHPTDVATAIAGEMLSQSMKGKHESATLWIPKKLESLARVMKLVPRALWRKMPR